MRHTFSFEKNKTTKVFPDYDNYGLVSQINRTAGSVASNLVEGSSRVSSKDQTHFSQLSFSSLMEVVCQLNISSILKFISEKDYKYLTNLAEEISHKINALRNYQLRLSKTNKRLN